MSATLATTEFSEKSDSSKTAAWFDDVVSTLRASQLKLESGVASAEEQDLYAKMIKGNSTEMSRLVRQQAQQYFVQTILYRYLSGAKEVIERCTSLAFSFNDSEILVWAEIGDDDENAETLLYTEEAKVNAEYHDHGFDMCLTIVEESDQLPIPSHYRVFKENRKRNGKS